MTYRFK